MVLGWVENAGSGKGWAAPGVFWVDFSGGRGAGFSAVRSSSGNSGVKASRRPGLEVRPVFSAMRAAVSMASSRVLKGVVKGLRAVSGAPARGM